MQRRSALPETDARNPSAWDCCEDGGRANPFSASILPEGRNNEKFLIILLILAVVTILVLRAAIVLIYGPNFGIYLKKPSPHGYVQQTVKFMDSQGIYSATDE